MKIKASIFLKLLTLVTAVIFGTTVAEQVQATEITNYTMNTSITKDGSNLTADTKVVTNESLAVTSDISFPDSQGIADGDTLTLKLPSQLTLITPLDFEVFDVRNANGDIVGSAKADPASQTVTVTFSDYFTRLPENKRISLRFNVRINNDTVKESGPVSFRFGQTDFNFQYQKDDGTAGDYEMKYGYQDKSDPNIVKWRIILNARQDMLRGMVISDSFGDGLTLVPGSLRAVRYAPVEGGIRNEAHLQTLPVLDNFTQKATFTQNGNGDVTGFTINFGDNYHWAMYIEYSTRVPEGVKVGDVVNNKLSWSATNFPKERTLERSVRLEAGTGDGSAERSKDVIIKAQKNLVGKELAQGQFTFGLYDDKGQLLQTTQNALDGSISFNAINYSKEGTFHYVIKEIPSQEEGYTYDSKEVRATVKVVNVFGEYYGSVTYEGDTTFTNTFHNVKSIAGQKTWVDSGSQNRPKSITVHLYANNQILDSKAVTEEDGWKYRFDNLPIYDENGQKINYTITESPVLNYVTSVNGYDITNTYVPPQDPKNEDPKKPDPKTPKTPDKPDPTKPDKVDPKKTVPNKTTKPVLPKTGDQASIWLYVAGAVGIVAVGALIFFGKKDK